MQLCLHQNTSAGAGFAGSLAGWARAGIQQVELTDVLLDGFLHTDTLAAAHRVVTDLGLTPVSAAAVLPDFWLPSPGRAELLEIWKRRCEQFASFGIRRIYCPAITTRKVTTADYQASLACLREAGEVARQFEMTALIEFARSSSFISTIPTALQLIRDAGHPHVQVLFDFYHFWTGMSRFEDLDAVRPGEIGHVHFQDVPAMPRELLDTFTRVIPGDGVAPLAKTLRKLGELGYTGPLSVELFLPEFTARDPYELAREIQAKTGPFIPARTETRQPPLDRRQP
ncbi:MAG: sugar phosphate isomerase/epimerase [Bryobacteraceae bacterium]|nr:sugar phosphate isomerase/epimerase [Bryobacteraceae bacterium]